MVTGEGASLASVLVVDDEPAVATVIAALLEQAGYQVTIETNPERALERLASARVDVVLTDLRMPGVDGLTLLRRSRQLLPDVPVVMISAHATVTSAIDALRAGAADFILKPIDRDELLFSIGKAAQRRLGCEVTTASPLLGDAPAFRETCALIAKAARSAATVLVRGDSGTGKELAAHAIHQASARQGGPFIAINCAALPDGLLESELFGYERGAFTGAVQRKPGRVELAEGGTLFLDEIGELSPSFQAKLLRLIEQREITPLGGTKVVKVDVRFIAATHRDLERAVRDGVFREDLYYRLNVIPLRMPCLSERAGDIPALARAFAGATPVDDAACARLSSFEWPGNVRQLRNFVERLLALSEGPSIGLSDVEREIARERRSIPQRPADPTSTDLEVVRRRAERERILEAIAEARGNRSLAARLLGLSRRTFYNKLDQLQIDANALPPPSNAPR